MTTEITDWETYEPGAFHDEMMRKAGRARAPCRRLMRQFSAFSKEELAARAAAAELAIKTMGISFTVYSDGENIDREWPFDLFPRVIPGKEWDRVAAGLIQRLRALNLFIDDIYNRQRVLDDGIVPRALIEDSKNFRPQCRGMHPRHGVWAHVCGTDLIRDAEGRFLVLEDNLRIPSGVSYMLENRKVTKRVLPEIFEAHSIRSIRQYTSQLFETLASVSPRRRKSPEVVVLTPGIFNSAYFEHAYLAREMGAELVEGVDLEVADDDCVYMRTIDGMERVDVIYRRVDDEFLDPEMFNSESMLGVPGLMRAWRAGNVAIANAPGAGVADDKAIYAYVPAIIEYYLDEKPILDNVKTWLCAEPEQCEYVLEHLDALVVKPVNESGGSGLMVGPHASERERRECAKRIREFPRNYIAQPTISLSTSPTLCGDAIEPRHIDLRPFVLQGQESYVTAGGLTRVALKRGSFVVNSSQGGGSKDTWIVD